MRNITQQAIKALMARQSFKLDNTSVVASASGPSELFLHGNRIAILYTDGRIAVTTTGWNTRTTLERLRGLPGVSIQTIKGQLYLNGKEWDGSWVMVTERIGNQPTKWMKETTLNALDNFIRVVTQVLDETLKRDTSPLLLRKKLNAAADDLHDCIQNEEII